MKKSATQPTLSLKQRRGSKDSTRQRRGSNALVEIDDANGETVNKRNERLRKNKSAKRLAAWRGQSISQILARQEKKKVPFKQDRSAFLLSTREKGDVIVPSLVEPWAGLSNMAVDNTLWATSAIAPDKQLLPASWATAPRFPPADPIKGPGPKYSRDDYEKPPGPHYSFGGGSAIRSSFVFGLVKDGLIYPNKPSTNDTGVGPGSYKMGEPALALKEKKRPVSLWSKSKSNRFKTKSVYDITPGPKYKWDKQWSKKGPSWGPKDQRDALRLVNKDVNALRKEASKEKEQPKTQMSRDDEEDEDGKDEQKEKKKKRKKKKFNQPRKAGDMPWNRSTWARRFPATQYQGYKLAKLATGHSSPGPVYFPTTDNWQLKIKPAKFKPRQKQSAWR